MKNIKQQKHSLKTMPDDLLYKSARYTNKENERNDDFNRRDEKKFRFMDVNSPKGNIIKAKMLLQQQMNVQKENIGNMNDNGKKEKEKEVRNNRKEQFEDARKRIQNLEEKIDNLRRYYNKTNQTGNNKRQKPSIFKSRSVQKLPLPSQIPAKQQQQRNQNTSSISSFVTQVAAPIQTLQSSSYTNLNFMTKQLKMILPKYYVASIVSAFCDNIKTTFTQLCKTHLNTSLQLLNLLKNNQKVANLKPSKPLPTTKKRTIIFDLDQTLIHCNESPDQPSDIKLNIPFFNGEIVKVGLNIRPWAKQCLKQLSEFYEIMVFTASHQCYGNQVANYLDPTGKIIAARYYRDSCFRTSDGYYIKDLRIINRPMQNMLLIDNAAYSYAYQIQNGIPIIPFYNDKSDIELRSLSTFLKSIHGSQNIQKQMCRQLKVDQYPKFSDSKELIKTLYAEY